MVEARRKAGKPRSFGRTEPHTLCGITPLQVARLAAFSLDNMQTSVAALAATQAGAALVPPDPTNHVPSGATVVTPDLYLGRARAVMLLNLLPPRPRVENLTFADPDTAVDPAADTTPSCLARTLSPSNAARPE